MTITYLQAHLQNVWTTDHNRRSLCRGFNKRIYIAYRSTPGAFDRVNIGWSDDNGITWTFEEIPGQGAFDNEGIAIAIDSNNNLIAVWEAGAEVWYRRKLASGAWQPPIVVASVGGMSCDHASVAVDINDTAHIAWRESAGATDDIRYNTVNAAGVLGAQINVTNLVVRRQVQPTIAVCRNNIAHIVWQGTGWGVNPAAYNIQYNTITAGVLGPQLGITDKAINNEDPELATDSNGNVHIVWLERFGLGTAGFWYRNNVGGAFNPPHQFNSYSSHGGMSITLDAEDHCYAFHSQPTIPGTLKGYTNMGGGWFEEYSITMDAQYNDIYTMHSYYPRSGGSSPNILSNNWLAYSFWPKPNPHAYLMFPSALPPITPPPPPPPPTAPNTITLPATEVR